jgi:hypothetical protein
VAGIIEDRRLGPDQVGGEAIERAEELVLA